MDNKSNIICRCCLSEEGSMKNMMEDELVLSEKRKIELLQIYTACSGVKSPPQTNEPWKNICAACEKKLFQFYEFREQCQESYRVLQERAKLLPELKQEVLSDSEENTQGIIYAAFDAAEPEQSAHLFNQVFLVKERDSVLEPVIKIEEPEVSVVEKEADLKDSAPEQTENDDLQSQGSCPDMNDFDQDQDTEVEEEKRKKRVKFSKSQPKLDDESFEIIADMPGLFMCFICDEILHTHRDYQNHKIMHGEVRRIDKKCFVCGEEVKGYMKHIDDKHKDYRPFECGTCFLVYQSLHPLRMHLYTHSKKMIFKCMAHKCGQKFIKPDILRQHIATTRHSVSLYHCLTCGYGFAKFILLLEHFKQNHDEQNTKKILPCFDCKKIFVHRKTMLDHKCEPAALQKSSKRSTKPAEVDEKDETVQLKAEKLSQTCPRCGKVFMDDDEFVCHQHSVCIEAPKYICATCGKEFVSAYRLNSHKVIHDNRKFVCDVCGMVFLSKSGLDGHKLAHTAGRAFKCHLCPAAFVEKSGLKVHLIIHDKKKYQCDLCGKRFRTYHYIKQHLFSIHQKGVHKFSCEVCGKTFVRRCDHSSHMRNSHHYEPVKCNLCQKEFRDKRLLKRHSAVHTTSYYECKQCGKTFTKPFGLKNHTFLHRGFSPYNCNLCPRKFIKKYMFSKHLQSHNAKFDEKIHAYQEQEINWRQLLADSFRTPHTQEGRDFSMATEVFDNV